MYLIALISFITLISTLFIKEGLDPEQIEEIKALEEKQNKAIKEQQCHEYFKYKWGQFAKHNPNNNSKLLN